MSAPMNRDPHPRPPLCSGYEIVCPDGQTRHYPYHNLGDAECDAGSYTARGCARWKKGVRSLIAECPQGEHTVRPIMFQHGDGPGEPS